MIWLWRGASGPGYTPGSSWALEPSHAASAPVGSRKASSLAPVHPSGDRERDPKPCCLTLVGGCRWWQRFPGCPRAGRDTGTVTAVAMGVPMLILRGFSRDGLQQDLDTWRPEIQGAAHTHTHTPSRGYSPAAGLGERLRGPPSSPAQGALQRPAPAWPSDQDGAAGAVGTVGSAR